jgi:hypothetical protein
MALPENKRQGWKGLPGETVYIIYPLVSNKKSFEKWAPRGNLSKLRLFMRLPPRVDFL